MVEVDGGRVCLNRHLSVVVISFKISQVFQGADGNGDELTKV